MSQRLPFLDFAKGRAIVTILLFHFLRHIDGLPQWCQLVLMMGGAGVHIFFLISGISLTIWRAKNNTQSSFWAKAKNLTNASSDGQSQDPSLSLRTTDTPSRRSINAQDDRHKLFYRKQLVGIYLPYIVCVSVIASSGVFFPSIAPETSRYAYLGHVFAYKMFDVTIIESYGFHFRFMSTMLQLYLVFPWLLWMLYKLESQKVRKFNVEWWKLFVLGCCLVSLVWICVVVWLDKGFERPWLACFLMYLREFGIGMAIGQWIMNSEKWKIIPSEQETLWNETHVRHPRTLGGSNRRPCEEPGAISDEANHVARTSVWIAASHKLPRCDSQWREILYESLFRDTKPSPRLILTIFFIALGCLGIYAILAIWGWSRGRVLNDVFAVGGYGGILVVGYLLLKKRDKKGENERKKEIITDIFCHLGRHSLSLYLRHGFLFLLFLKFSAYENIPLTRWWVSTGLLLVVGVILGGQYVWKKVKSSK